MTRRTVEERFWSKVNKEAPGECWEWTAYRMPNGYGRFGVGGGLVALAHRWSYEFAIGPIPDGYHVDHQCFNRSCVNPAHLVAVAPKENIERRKGANRNSISGIRGVRYTPYGWSARIKHERVERYLGVFPTAEEAQAAYDKAASELYSSYHRWTTRGVR